MRNRLLSLVAVAVAVAAVLAVASRDGTAALLIALARGGRERLP